MAVSAQREMIWQGRLHLGDEPGIYGDASFAGLSVELPFTVTRSEPTAQKFDVVLETADLETFSGYPGHDVTIFQFVPDPSKPFHSLRQVLASATFQTSDHNTKKIGVTVGSSPGPFRLSARLSIDTSVNPGLYDDFVWRKLSLSAENFTFFAAFGFSA